MACSAPAVHEDWSCDACGHRVVITGGVRAFAPDAGANGSGFDPAYFDQLAELEARNFWFVARNELIVWALRRWAPDARRLLEIGCGTGFVLSAVRAAYPHAELTGSELFTPGLRIARERVPSATFYQMDATTIPFRDHFDVIGAFDVLEHVDDDRAVLAAARRALRPDGRLLVSVPQHPALWSPQDVQAFHVRRYTARGLRSKLEAAGFEIVRISSFVSLLLPVMLGARLWMRLRPTRASFEAIDGLRVSRVVNAAFLAVMRLEGFLTRNGVTWPAGGSLLIVARPTRGATSA